MNTVIKITDLEKKILTLLFQITSKDGEMCVGFKYLSGVEYNLDVKAIRRGCRSLRRKGLAEFYHGLMNEDGEVAGSGYCISSEGNELAEELEL